MKMRYIASPSTCRFSAPSFSEKAFVFIAAFCSVSFCRAASKRAETAGFTGVLSPHTASASALYSSPQTLGFDVALSGTLERAFAIGVP